MYTKLQPYGMDTARILMALIFILSGLSKIGAAEAIRGYMGAMHVLKKRAMSGCCNSATAEGRYVH